MPNCIHCNAPIAPNSRFCTSCGKAQTPTGSTSPQPGAVAAPPAGQRPAPAGPATAVMQRPMAQMVIKDSDGNSFNVPLANSVLTFGRAKTNNIVVNSPFVSSNHARIEPDSDGHRIIDTGSTNGILFNGVRVPMHDFRDGESVRVGDPLTGNFVTLTYQNQMRPAQEQAVTSVTRFELTAPEINIGREGALKLDNPQVSRNHAVIRRVNNGHELRDLGSTNGTFVNGARVNVHLLRPNDVITIGPYKLLYDGRSLDQFNQAGSMRIDAHSLLRIVGGGKIILNNVSLVIRPREFVALVGGSGAGKSTLMGTLSGYNRANKGMVLVNGDDYYANFDAYRNILGYVPQDDILHKTLPVDTALRYAAKLRLPADTAESEIETRIERVLQDVEMGIHRKKRIDQLSGGQRKRVSIGSELLADPSLFFLDEPTSGLDPGLEKKMMYTLRRLADSGRTIILVTHATANITQCDHVVFMADGRMVWFGPPQEALPFFGVTSGDFADIYTKLEGFADDSNPLTHGELKTEFGKWRQHNPQAKGPPRLSELWEIRFRESEAYRRHVWQRLQEGPKQIGGPAQQPAMPMPQTAAPGAYPSPTPQVTNQMAGRPKPPPVSAMRQWWVLTKRYLHLIASDKRNLAIMILQAPIIGLILLLVAEEGGLTWLAGTNGRMIPFLLGTVAVWFGVLNSAREITKESAIYRRERLANLKIWPYLMSKVTVLSFFCLIQSIILMGILLLKVDFGPGAKTLQVNVFSQTAEQIDITRKFIFGHWGDYLVTTFLTAMTGLGLGLFISSWVSSEDKAMSIIPFALIPQIVFALALLPLPGAIAWISYFIASRWSMESYGTITQFLDPRDPNTKEVFPTVSYAPGAGHVLTTWAILIAYTAIMLVLTAWMLKRKDEVE